MAQKLEQDITGLLETSARTTQDILELCQEIDGCGTLSGLVVLAQKSEQDFISLLETSAKNAQAILELRQEIAGCVAIKTTVDNIKNRQLTQIRENITRVRTGLADMTTQYNTLDMKYYDALDVVNTQVDDILREGIPPTTATTDAAATPPVCNTDSSPSSPPTDGASMSPPANVVPDSAPPGDGRMDSSASEDMPCSDAPDRHLESRHAYHSDRPNLPRKRDFRDTGGSTSVQWRPQLDSRRSPHANGTYLQEEGNFDSYQGLPRTPSNPYYGSRDTRNESARSDPRRYTAHVPPIPVGPRRWMWITARTMKPVFHKGDRLHPPAIGTGANLLTLLGIAPLMPQLLLVGNIMGTKGGTILLLPKSLKVVDIRTRAERYLYTAMILFSSTAGLWMHGKIAAHNSVVRWWIES